MKTKFQMTWDAEEIARAFKITVPDVQEYLTDGRRVSFIIERRLKWENPGWTLAPSEGAGYDLSDPNGGLWEVRSVTRGGVYFNPSNQVGSGRKFAEEGFLTKLKALAGFILADIVHFPHVEIYVVPIDLVLSWYKSKLLGKSAKISRNIFLARLVPQLADVPESI